MFCAILRYLYTSVAHVNNLLFYSLHLISHYYGIFLVPIQNHITKHRTTFALFYRQYCISSLMQLIYSILCVLTIFPVNCIFCPQSRLVHLCIRRSSRNSAKIYPVDKESIRSTEYSTNVVQTSHFIKYHNQRKLVCLLAFPLFSAFLFQTYLFIYNYCPQR